MNWISRFGVVVMLCMGVSSTAVGQVAGKGEFIPDAVQFAQHIDSATDVVVADA